MVPVPWVRHLLWQAGLGGWDLAGCCSCVSILSQAAWSPSSISGNLQTESLSITSCSAQPEVVDVAVMGSH